MVPDVPNRFRRSNRPAEAVALGSLVLLLIGLYLWAIAVARTGYGPLADLLGSRPGLDPSNRIRVIVLPAFLVRIAGVGFGAWVYASYRGIEIPVGLPERSSRATAVLTVLAVPVLVALTAVVGRFVFSASVAEMSRAPRYSPRTQLSWLVYSAFVPALLTGVGYGLAFFGVVQERLREVTTPRHAVALTPILVGFFWQTRDVALNVLQFDVSLSVAVVVVAAGVALGGSIGLGYRMQSVEDVLRARYVPVFAFGLLGAAILVTTVVGPNTSLFDVLQLGVFALAAYGYERTRSIWVPILALAAFPAATHLAAFVESTGGLV